MYSIENLNSRKVFENVMVKRNPFKTKDFSFWFRGVFLFLEKGRFQEYLCSRKKVGFSRISLTEPCVYPTFDVPTDSSSFCIAYAWHCGGREFSEAV